MADNFSGVSIAFDKTSYNSGDTMTLTISGQAVSSAGSSSTEQPSVLVTASDGTTTTLSPAPVTINTTVDTNLNVVMTSVSDPSGRTWVVAANGLTATATA